MSFDDFLLISPMPVSRETYDKLVDYVSCLFEYNKTHNIIGSNEADRIWERHIVDCIQLGQYMDKNKKIIDIGSGAGLPGMVLALMGFDITLVESNSKKTNFLKSVSCETATVIPARCENIKNKYDIITARAVTNLRNLLSLTIHLSKKDSVFIFPKGKNWKKELIDAEKDYKFDLELKDSLTSSESKILIMKNIKCRK
tara:strand:- start:18599 stop:19195 length:597 start_codon:yes stop_codon:yes gene_type:complete